MMRAVALCVCLAATLTLAVPARGGGDEGADGLARAVLTAHGTEAEDLLDEVTELSHKELRAVLEAVRREYRALADSKGATTELAVVGAYKVDRQSLEETVLAQYRATLLRDAPNASLPGPKGAVKVTATSHANATASGAPVDTADGPVVKYKNN